MSGVVIRNETGKGKVVDVISQKSIEKYLRLKKQLGELATEMLNSLKLGATVEEGNGLAYLDEGTEKRPNWRAALLEKCGKAVVDEVRDNTERKPYCRLRVEGPKKK